MCFVSLSFSSHYLLLSSSTSPPIFFVASCGSLITAIYQVAGIYTCVRCNDHITTAMKQTSDVYEKKVKNSNKKTYVKERVCVCLAVPSHLVIDSNRFSFFPLWLNQFEKYLFFLPFFLFSKKM